MSDGQRLASEADEISFFADYYEHQHYNPLGWRLRLERECSSLRQELRGQRPQTMLSVGCGDGQFELMMAPFVDRIVALDLSPQAIDVARRKAAEADIRNVEFHCISIHSLTLDQQFDVITCVAFLHHVAKSDLESFLKTCADHLSPGGLFYSQDPNEGGILRAIGRIVLGEGYHKYHSPDERELDPRQTARQLEQAGLHQVAIGHIDFTLIPALFILAKRPGWILHLCLWLDWLWCHSPLAPWSSGFKLTGRRPS